MKRIKKISTKIMMVIIICILPAAILLGVITGYQSKAEITKVSKESLLNLAEVEALKIEQKLSEAEMFSLMEEKVIKDSINVSIVANDQVAMDAYEDSMLDTLIAMLEGSNTESSWMIFNSNVINGANGLSLTKASNGSIVRNAEYDANELSREGNDWWYKAIDDGSIWTSPYLWVDPGTGTETTFVSYGKRVEKDGKVIGVIGTDLDMAIFTEELASISIYESGYMSLIHPDGTVLYHNNSDIKDLNTYADGAFKFILKEAAKEPAGIIDYEMGGQPKIAAYYTLSNGWIAMANPYVDEMLAGQHKLIRNLMIVITFGVLIALAGAFILGRSISKPIVKLAKDIEVMADGDTSADIKVTTQDEVGILQSALIKMSDNISEQARNAQKIAEGDLSLEISQRSEKDVLALSMKKVVEELRKLVKEANQLSDAARNGNLTVRGDERQFKGGYNEIIKGFNNTLDAIEEPLNISMTFISKLSEGDAKEPIANADQFNGSYKELVINLNKVLESLYDMTAEVNSLTEASVNGQLSHRADVSKLKGGYADLVSGMNQTLDSVIKPIEEASDVLKHMADGDLGMRVEGAYAGEHAVIKDALNSMGENVSGYIDEMSSVLQQMANKDFSKNINRTYVGDFKILGESINFIIEQFNEVLSEIYVSAEQVEEGAEQVASSSQNLSQGSSEQASSVEEMSSSITEVAEQTRDNAKNADQANALSILARDNAEKGNNEMTDMISAMNNIKNSSNNISNIIKVIDDIAFQTNILALNAAVEAARAGEHGKGFAVVAEEVRNLAARSAEAAKETTGLIDESINQVDEGYEIAQKTAGALKEIVKGVADAVEIVSDIASASNEQAQAIDQINVGVDQISQVTQSNMATAEQSAAASEEMASQSQELKHMIGAFVLKDSQKNQRANQVQRFEPITIEEPRIEIESKEDIEIEIDLNNDDFGKF